MSPETTESGADERRANPERIPAFVDGTFAIVITILVLEISVLMASFPSEEIARQSDRYRQHGGQRNIPGDGDP